MAVSFLCELQNFTALFFNLSFIKKMVKEQTSSDGALHIKNGKNTGNKLSFLFHKITDRKHTKYLKKCRLLE